MKQKNREVLAPILCLRNNSGDKTMPGLYLEKSETNKNNHTRITCNCKSCPCKYLEYKRLPGSENVLPPNCIVFQLPKFREPKLDTYTHTVYRKEMCNKHVMNQHARLAQRRVSKRTKQTPPVFEQERFVCKTTAASDFQWHNSRIIAACKAQFPRTKRKENLYFSPGEYTCKSSFPQQPLSHEDYSPKVPIKSAYRKSVKECDRPPFEGKSCYDREFKAPPLEAYAVNRKSRKRLVFD